MLSASQTIRYLAIRASILVGAVSAATFFPFHTANIAADVWAGVTWRYNRVHVVVYLAVPYPGFPMLSCNLAFMAEHLIVVYTGAFVMLAVKNVFPAENAVICDGSTFDGFGFFRGCLNNIVERYLLHAMRPAVLRPHIAQEFRRA